MKLSRKFVLIFVTSICSIAIINIGFFYVFYNSYIRLYLSEKIESREDITLEYINNIIERQTLEDINGIFDGVEIELYELLDLNDGSIPLQSEENINIVVDFLVKSGVSAKFIEEVIPENNLEKVLEQLRQEDTPESNFIHRLARSIIIGNIVILLLFSGIIFILTRRIIDPISKVSDKIKTLKIGKNYEKIQYKKRDEVGTLIDSINALNKKLSVQERIRSRLLADISHELKTPITSIQCYLEGISDGVIPLDEKNLESISSEMGRLIELVNKIMEFEKFENSQIILEKQTHSPYSIIENIIQTSKESLKETKQNIIVSGSKNIELLLDKNIFTQMVYNIISNFRKYAGNNTTLTIHISADSLIFRDNGQGISKKEIPFLFEKFYQGKIEKSGRIDMRGIGVGLSIVKKGAYAHAWDIEIESDISKGFCLTLRYN